MAADNGLRSLSDEELAKRAKLPGLRLALHKRSSGIGCASAAILLVPSAFLLYFVVNVGVFEILLFMIVSPMLGMIGFLCVWKVLEHLAALGKHSYIHELSRRCGMLAVDEYLEDEKAIPDLSISILAAGHGLPHGKDYFVRMRFRRGGGAGVESFVSKRSQIDWVDGTHPKDLVAHKQEELSEKEEGEIQALTGQLPYGESESIDSDVRDGFPCQMTVLHHTSGKLYRLSCNLAGSLREPSDKPTIKLLQDVMGMVRD